MPIGTLEMLKRARGIVWMVIWSLHWGAFGVCLRICGERVWLCFEPSKSFWRLSFSIVTLVCLFMPIASVALASCMIWPFVVMAGGVSRKRAYRLIVECRVNRRLPRISTDIWRESYPTKTSGTARMRAIFGAITLAVANVLMVAPVLTGAGNVLRNRGFPISPIGAIVIYWIVSVMAARHYRPQSSLLWSLALPGILTTISMCLNTRRSRMRSKKTS